MPFLLERAFAHTTRRTDRREEGCERSYYHLHRQLNHSLLLHDLISLFFCHTDLTDLTDLFFALQKISQIFRCKELTDFLCAVAAFLRPFGSKRQSRASCIYL
jgi:hypothetical protein